MSQEWREAHAHTSMQLPKPRKSDRKKAQIDTSGMAFPKRHPVVDAKYRLFVRQHPCSLFAAAECSGQIVTAHLTPVGMASRSQKQTDAACVPLCDYHHDLIDRRVWIEDATRNELLIICWSRALELREAWWRHQ